MYFTYIKLALIAQRMGMFSVSKKLAIKAERA